MMPKKSVNLNALPDGNQITTSKKHFHSTYTIKTSINRQMQYLNQTKGYYNASATSFLESEQGSRQSLDPHAALRSW